MIPLFILAIEDDDDREFMAQLYLHYNRLMYSTVIKIIHDPTTTEDLVQNVLVRLIDKLQDLRLKDRDHLINYVIATCRNHALNYIRDSGKHTVTYLDDGNCSAGTDSSRDHIEELIINHDRIELLSKVFEKLDNRTRFLLESYYVLEQPLTEIAEELGIKPASVRMALTRARNSAKQAMEKYDVESLV